MKIMKHWKLIAGILAVVIVWSIIPGIKQLSPLAWVCPTCVLDNVPLGSDTSFRVVLSSNTAIANLKVKYYIYGPGASTTFYTKPKASGVVSAPATMAAGSSVELSLPVYFNRATWNAGNDYHLIVEVMDGISPVGLANTMYDTSYYNNAACRAKVDSLAVSVNGQMMTCAVDATQAECSALAGTWYNGACCKSVADTYKSYCGGVAWKFNLLDYTGSVTIYIGSVTPHFG